MGADDPARGPRIGWREPSGTEHLVDLGAKPVQVTVGRREDCDVPVPWDQEVSRVHAVLERVGGDWTVRDDGLSRNGTWVNGERIQGSRRLQDGDTVRVGRTLLVIQARSRPDSLLTKGATRTSDLPISAAPRAVVNLCGPLVLRIDGRGLEAELSGRKGRLLFAYLAANRERAVRRDDLIDILWPSERPASPEDGLTVYLARLRTVLGKESIAGRAEVRLDLGLDAYVDVEAAQKWNRDAQRHLREADPAGAIAAARAALSILYQDFLPEFDDHEWVQERRVALQLAVPELLETEAEAALALGASELPLAEAAARALLEQRPYRESDYRLLMRAHAARGNAAEALLVYDQLRKRLMDDLGVPPTPETRALYEQLVAQR